MNLLVWTAPWRVQKWLLWQRHCLMFTHLVEFSVEAISETSGWEKGAFTQAPGSWKVGIQRTVSMMLNNTTPHVHFNHFRKSPSDQLPVSKITLFWLNFWLLLEYRYFLFWHKWDITLPLEKVMDMCSHCFSPFSSGTISQDDNNFPPFKSRIFFF